MEDSSLASILAQEDPKDRFWALVLRLETALGGFDGRLKVMDEKLDALNDKVRIANGRTGKNEEAIEELQKDRAATGEFKIVEQRSSEVGMPKAEREGQAAGVSLYLKFLSLPLVEKVVLLIVIVLALQGPLLPALDKIFSWFHK